VTFFACALLPQHLLASFLFKTANRTGLSWINCSGASVDIASCKAGTPAHVHCKKDSTASRRAGQLKDTEGWPETRVEESTKNKTGQNRSQIVVVYPAAPPMQPTQNLPTQTPTHRQKQRYQNVEAKRDRPLIAQARRRPGIVAILETPKFLSARLIQPNATHRNCRGQVSETSSLILRPRGVQLSWREKRERKGGKKPEKFWW
jgi:hypothetical protein